MSTESRVVVVTGASAGIGLAASVQFAAQGDTVVASVRDLNRKAALDEAAAQAGVELDIVQLDVADDASVDRAFEEIHSRYDAVDVLVGNAGIGAPGALEETSMDFVRRAMEVNFFGVVRTTKAVLPRMRERGSGRLLAVSSLAGVMGQPFTDAYSASKHAVEGLYESMQPVLKRFGVHVSIVEPGPVGSEFHEKGVADRNHDAETRAIYDPLWNRYDALMAEGNDRKQSPEDAAAAIVAVASEAEPHLRYQTHKFATRLASMKIADLNGDAVTRFTSTWLDAKSD
jgi:NAD(P)-dependent dehydrogenase (short-subunit alcohol dehydrogenase family)